MRTIPLSVIVLLVSLSSLSVNAAQRAASANSPDGVVRELYRVHNNGRGHVFDRKGKKYIYKFFDQKLADLLWKDITETPEGEVGNLDFDPLYNAQDTEIKNFAVGRADIKGETGVVPVTFTNFGGKVSIKFNVKLVNGNWKIDDINYGEIGTLSKILKSSGEPETASGNFEGKYQVGDTSCTVKPVKMAYEVRWAKGSGTELFFPQDRTTFESSSDKGESNRFVFDDESYDKGTFYRADGKTFPIRRAK